MLKHGVIHKNQKYITGGAVAQLCVNSHWLSQWEPCIFDPLQSTESTSLNRSLKNLSQVITSTTSTVVQNLVENPYMGGFWANRWNITEIYFLSNLPTGQTLTTFSRLMAQITRTHARVCLFLAFVDTAAHLWDQIAPKPQFLGCE